MIKFCSLFSGSSGNSMFISTQSAKVLIDVGLSAVKIIDALISIGEEPKSISAILISHEHLDHIRGAGPLSRKFNIPIYANKNTWDVMDKNIGKIDHQNRKYFIENDFLYICDMKIYPFPIPHDAANPVGFCIYDSSKKITLVTDVGHINNCIYDNILGSEILVLEANHNEEVLKMGPYPWKLKKRILGENGHLSNENAAKLILDMSKNGTKKFFLGHLSKENNFPELAFETVKNILNEENIVVGKDVFVNVLSRNSVSEVHYII